MNVLDLIAALEDFVAAILEAVTVARASDRTLHRAAVDAIIALLDEREYSTEDLLTPEVQREIAEALEAVFPDWTQALREEIAESVRTLAERTKQFYDDVGLDLPDLRQAARRSQVTQALSEGLERGLQHIRQQLTTATVEVIREASLRGDIDRAEIERQIEERAGASTRTARVQASAAVGGYNQAHRNVIAERAGLEHWLYNGTLQTNSRHFCRIHIRHVFTTEQVNQMRNGMLEPVMLFTGGFNCRHSWLPVNPEWDLELAEKIVEAEPSEVCLDAACNRKIIVVADEDRITRLKRQIPLARRGFIYFRDAESNSEGFVAAHEDWWQQRFRFRAGSKKRRAYDDQLDEAIQQAEAGAEVRLVLDENDDE